MTRHQRNCTAGTVYTYHERQKDAAQSGYGTNKTRLGKDSVGDFDCCCLTLQPCPNPVITEEGYLYDKEAIIEYVLKQKQDYERKLKEYHRQCRLHQDEESQAKKSAKEDQVKAFIEKERSITSKPLNPFTEAPPAKRAKMEESKQDTPTTSSSSSNGNSKAGGTTENGEKKSELPSFWIPSLTPQAKATAIQKPDKTVYCPMSKKPLKVKNLIPVNFVRADDANDNRPMVAKQIRYKCAVTHDVLSNKTPCAVLRPSGKVVTLDCVEKIIKKDMRDPFTGDTLKDNDIIKIRRGGTGFASAAETSLEAKKARPVMMAS
ncbi:nitric oxide synthase-interacting protein-like [Patiria miniata]|uniref:Nitric oxide synthase-interacting protein zinc-finger domain-containing protein n=1 Tax=Patiria miniata TaxID=46514 RepID=A0A913ZVC5_PATMI|nr:nitric oxide synthase-interacting protein-like [Patiria miniata]